MGTATRHPATVADSRDSNPFDSCGPHEKRPSAARRALFCCQNCSVVWAGTEGHRSDYHPPMLRAGSDDLAIGLRPAARGRCAIDPRLGLQVGRTGPRRARSSCPSAAEAPACRGEARCTRSWRAHARHANLEPPGGLLPRPARKTKVRPPPPAARPHLTHLLARRAARHAVPMSCPRHASARARARRRPARPPSPWQVQPWPRPATPACGSPMYA